MRCCELCGKGANTWLGPYCAECGVAIIVEHYHMRRELGLGGGQFTKYPKFSRRKTKELQARPLPSAV